jgi:hypothetical protein
MLCGVCHAVPYSRGKHKTKCSTVKNIWTKDDESEQFNDNVYRGASWFIQVTWCVCSAQWNMCCDGWPYSWDKVNTKYTQNFGQSGRRKKKLEVNESDFAFRFFAVYVQSRLIFSLVFFYCHYMLRPNQQKAEHKVRSPQCNRMLQFNIMNESGSGSCPVVGFGICGVEPSSSAQDCLLIRESLVPPHMRISCLRDGLSLSPSGNPKPVCACYHEFDPCRETSPFISTTAINTCITLTHTRLIIRDASGRRGEGNVRSYRSVNLYRHYMNCYCYFSADVIKPLWTHTTAVSAE